MARNTHAKLTPAKLRSLKLLAERIDADEASEIKAAGRAAFTEHERMLSVIRSLKAERKRRGLSLADVAAVTGIAKPNLSRLENSEDTTPSFDTLQRYARAVGKSLRLNLVNAR